MNNNKQTILLAGGGTLGPVMPLLAVAEELDSSKWKIVFAGTRSGPERTVVTSLGYDFFDLPTVKWRRYFSWQNVIDLLKLPWILVHAVMLLIKLKPKVIVSAGGYVAVPLIWMGKLFGVKIVVHQQDIEIGLANKLTLFCADAVTAAFSHHQRILKKYNVMVTGNPVRKSILQGRANNLLEKFGFDKQKPLVLAFGGGTGALRLNEIIRESASLLLQRDIQVLHLTGRNKMDDALFLEKISDKAYVAVDFLNQEMADAYAAASVVICRAGLSTITELSYLGKPAIVIPMPGTHQEKNANFVAKKEAALILNEHQLNAKTMFENINELINDEERLERLKKNIKMLMPHEASTQIALIVNNLTKND